MKSVGIIKAIDKLGRVVIPKEIRNKLGIIDDKDSFEVYCDEDRIILKKYQDSCVFCKNTENLFEYGDYFVCESCIEKLKLGLEEKKLNIELSSKQ